MIDYPDYPIFSLPGSSDWAFTQGPKSIVFNIGDTWALRITKDGVTGNPEVAIDDAAKAILAALELQIRGSQMTIEQIIEIAQRAMVNPLWLTDDEKRALALYCLWQQQQDEVPS